MAAFFYTNASRIQVISNVMFDIVPRTAPDIIDIIAHSLALFALAIACSCSPFSHNLFTCVAFAIATIASGQKQRIDTSDHVRLLSGQLSGSES